MSHMYDVYISGPLQGASDLADARRHYERLADYCRSLDLRPYLPHLATDPQRHAEVSPEEVYRRDRAAMAACRLIVADIGTPSSGVGAEVAIACQQGQPVIGIYSSEQRPSRFLAGLLLDSATADVVRYDDWSQLTQQLAYRLAEWHVPSQPQGTIRPLSTPHR